MKIAIASDHAGFEFKERIKRHLIQIGDDLRDFGPRTTDPVDYPDLIRPAAEAVARGEYERGIVIGGSGNGEAIVANRVKGIRCAVCWNIESAMLSRQHNDANMLSIGQRLMNLETALAIVNKWLETRFEEGRHIERIRKIDLGM